jgi:hypothetical protein
MMFIARAFLVASVIALALVLFWRGRRSDRWQSMGLCYQCGGTLGLDSKPVTLRFKAPPPAKHVNFCGRCASHRKIWSVLVGAMIAALVGLVWFRIRNT